LVTGKNGHHKPRLLAAIRLLQSKTHSQKSAGKRCKIDLIKTENAKNDAFAEVGHTATHSSPTLMIRQRPMNRVCRTEGQALVNPREMESCAPTSEQSRCEQWNELSFFIAR